MKNIGRFQKNNGMFFSIHFILFLVAKNALLTVGFIRNKYIYPHVKKQAACHNRFLTHRPYMIRLLTQLFGVATVWVLSSANTADRSGLLCFWSFRRFCLCRLCFLSFLHLCFLFFLSGSFLLVLLCSLGVNRFY